MKKKMLASRLDLKKKTIMTLSNREKIVGGVTNSYAPGCTLGNDQTCAGAPNPCVPPPQTNEVSICVRCQSAGCPTLNTKPGCCM